MKRRNRTKNRAIRQRHLTAEQLESRAMLATLGLGVEFYEASGAGPVTSLRAGGQYNARVVVQVTDSNVGVISLPLNYSWDPAVLELIGPEDPADTVPPTDLYFDGTFPRTGLDVPESLVTGSFPFQRGIEAYNANADKFDPTAFNPGVPGSLDQFYNIQGIRGGALPAAGSGMAIATNGAKSFFTEELPFRVKSDVLNGTGSTFTIALDGSMSFAAGEALTEIVGISGATGMNLPSSTMNQIVQATLPVTTAIDIGGTKTETDANNIIGVPATPVTIQLDFGNDGVFDGPNDMTTQTDAAGNYNFQIDLAAFPTSAFPLSYSVQEVLPDGRVRLSPASDKYIINIAEDGTVSDPAGAMPELDFANQVVVVRGTKFQDLADQGTIGVRDPADIPLPGVTIHLDLNSDSTIDDTATTDSNGRFQFTMLPMGTHTVFEEPNTNQTFPLTTAGGPDSYVVTVGETGWTVATQQNANVPFDELDFGNRLSLASIIGIKRIDSNQNGVFDPIGDAAQSGVTITLDVDSDGLSANDLSDVTDSTGRFTISDVPDGMHLLREAVPNGFDNLIPGTAGYQVSVVNGVITPAGDFNFLNTSVQQSLAGYVYTDTNLDGVRDSGEIGLPGVTVRLISSTPGVAVRTTVTRADGWYNFSGIEPGTYSIQEIQPANFVDASITPGRVFPGATAIGTPSGFNQFDDIVIAAGQNGTEYNFGENLGRVTKRMVLARGNVHEEVFSNLGIDATTVTGTAGDDVIRIELSNDNWRVTINGQQTLAPTSGILIVDASAGNDQVQVIGGSGDDEVHIQQGQLAMTSDTTSGNGVLVLGAERMTADGRLGDNLAVLEGSTGSDQLTAANDSAIINLGNSGAVHEVLSFDQVRANNPVGGSTNQASVAAIDYALQLVGQWNR